MHVCLFYSQARTHPYVVCQEGNIKETLAVGMRSPETREGLYRGKTGPAEAAGKSIGYREHGEGAGLGEGAGPGEQAGPGERGVVHYSLRSIKRGNLSARWAQGAGSIKEG